MWLDQIINLPPQQIADLAEQLQVAGFDVLQENQLIFCILRQLKISQGISFYAKGYLEIIDQYGFLRLEAFNGISGPYDVYIAPTQIKKFHLMDGDFIEGEVRPPKTSESFPAMLKILKVNDEDIKLINYRIATKALCDPSYAPLLNAA